MKTKTKQEDLPKEWIDLVKEAVESNVTKDEFKKYLQKIREEKEKGER